jgi:transposase
VRVINIDEYRTSKNGCRCGEQMRKSRLVEYENGSFSTSNGILSCRVCKMSLNRDINGAINIHHLVYNHLNNLERPTWSSR